MSGEKCKRAPRAFTVGHFDSLLMRYWRLNVLLEVQVRTLESPNPLKATYTVVHMFAVLLLASVPSLILNLPVGIVARYNRRSQSHY